MSVDTTLEQLFQEGESKEKIIAKLLDSKDKEYKTEITNILSITSLDVLSDYVKDAGFGDMASKALKKWLEWYRINAISHKRQSRKEVVDALRAMAETEIQKRRMQLLVGGK